MTVEILLAAFSLLTFASALVLAVALCRAGARADEQADRHARELCARRTAAREAACADRERTALALADALNPVGHDVADVTWLWSAADRPVLRVLPGGREDGDAA